eukprot:PITA_34275
MEIESVEKDPSEDFTLIKKIGCGHMSKVFLVVHRRSKKLYALKVMSKGVGRQGGAAIRYASVEKDILSTLNHPFLPSLFTYFESDNHTFLAMKYCSGGDMNVLRLSQPNQTFSESAARFYAAEIILALEYLHDQGIVYRDLKPENVLVQDNGHIMLSDFDLSLRLPSRGQIAANDAACPTKYDKFSNSRSNFNWRSDRCKVKGDFSSHNSKSDNSSPTEFRHSRSHSLVGTREYIAPEILWCTGHSFPVDWWAFGIFLYEMINGRTPFCGANRKETFFNIMCKDPHFAGPYSALQDLIEKLLVKEPSKRLGSLRGVEEVKDHEFFRGLRWDALEFVDRPPFLPFLTSAVEEIDSEIEDQSNESQEIKTKKSLVSDDEFSCSDKSTL